MANLQAPPATGHEIIIDNREIPNTGFIAAPLVAIRPVTTTAGSLWLTKINITKDLLVRAATGFPEVKAELDRLNIDDANNLSMTDFVQIINQSDYGNRYLYRPDNVTLIKNAPSIVTVSSFEESRAEFWDARTLTNMLITGVIDTNNTNISLIDGKQVPYFRIDSEYARPIHSINVQTQALGGYYLPAEIGQKFVSVKDDITSYDALQRSMLENVGEITFGIPVVYTAEEKGLYIPESIKKSFDVYWIDLVVTYRDMNPQEIDELAFNVAVPDQSVALKLVPLRVGLDLDYSKTENAPEIGVEYGGAKVSVGEYFSQTVSYRHLKPTIEGYGEGERLFSWKLVGEAISGGSHRFAAILRVPKDTTELNFAFSGHARLSKSWIGEWYDGELVAGTDSWIVPVSF